MKHVVWDDGARGPGVDQARAFLRAYYSQQLDTERMSSLPESGPFDDTLRKWVRRFQYAFNRSPKPVARAIKLPENGAIDWSTRLMMKIDEKLAVCDSACRAAVHLPDGIVAEPAPLTPLERAAAEPGKAFVGNAYRVRNLDKLLAALGLEDQLAGTTSTRRIAPLFGEGYFLVPKGDRLYPEAIRKSECAALVQSLTVSNTNQWRRGPHVRDVAMLAPGTVIATLGEGIYPSDYSGRSHVGIFLSKSKDGLVMLDQWVGADGGELGIRFKRFQAGPIKADPARYLFDRDHSTRVSFQKNGETFWRHDQSFKAAVDNVGNTGDGNAYYVLLDNGTVARRDSPDTVPRTKEDDHQAVKAMVDRLFEGIDLGGDAKARGAKLREELEGLKPAGVPR